MKVNIRKAVVIDFMPFARVELELPETGLFFVHGVVEGDAGKSSNGSGKSSLFEAITWGLFGKTLRGIAGDDVVRYGSPGRAEVVLEVDVDGTTYYIDRTRTSRTSSTTVAFYTIDAAGVQVPVSVGSVNDINQKICLTLGFNFQLFKNSVMFGQGLPYRFIQADDTEKKSILDEIADLGWVKAAAENTKIARDSYEAIRRDLESHQSATVAEIAGAVQRVQRCRDEVRGLEARKSVAPPADEAQRVRELTQAIGDLTDMELSGRLHLNLLATAMRELEAKKIELQRRSAAALSARARVAAEMDAVKAQAAALEAKWSAPRLGDGDVCPECGSTVSTDTLDTHIHRQLESLRSKLDGLRMVFGKAEAECEEAADALDTHQESQTARRKEERDAEAGVVRAERDLAVARMGLDRIAHDRAAREANIDDQIAGATRRLDEAVRDYQAAVGKKAEGETSIALVKKILSAIDFWTAGFGNRGLKSLVFENIIPFLNSAARRYAEILTDGNLEITFSTTTLTRSGETRDKIDVVVFDRSNGSVYDQSSGGERRRADLIVLLAIHDLIQAHNGLDVNLQIFDEVCESLDPVGTEKVLELLQERSDYKAIFIISHDAELGNGLGQHITVTKSADGTSSVAA